MPSRPGTGHPPALRYVGDLSRADARLLAELAQRARHILEYGVGASTQIFAQAAPPGTDILSLDTDDYWLERTRVLLDTLAPGHAVRLIRFETLSVLERLPESGFDLIFDDGAAELRLEFALACWRFLAAGGRLVLHDTRRAADVGNVLATVWRFFREIERIDLNPEDSNLAIIHKCPAKPYLNWNREEGRRSWEVGDDDLSSTLRRLRERG